MSVDVSTLAIQVQSDGVSTASGRLDQLARSGAAAENSTTSLSTSFSKLSGYISAAVAGIAALKLTEYIKDATMLAARVETLGVVMKTVGNNAGYTGAQMEGYTASLKKMGITTQESMSSLIKMAGANMDLAKATQLARVAQDAAVIGGINSSEAYGRLIQGIRSGETEILKTIGINVQFDQGYKALAATLGKTTEQLTSTEKTASRMNEVIRFGTNIAGAYEASMGTAGKQMLSMSRYTEELKLLLGQAFTPMLTTAVMSLVEALKEANTQAARHKDVLAALAQEMVNPMRLFTDFGLLLKGTYQTLDALTVLVSQSPGAFTLMTVAAYSSVGGITGLTAAFTALTAAIATAVATNPVAWLTAAGVTTYLAARSFVKSADEIAYAYAGMNLTGEAYYKAEQNRAAAANKAWDDLKKRAQWMNKEGGIPIPASLQDPEQKRIETSNAATAAQKAKEEAAAKAAAAEKLAEQNRRWTATYADLRKEISALNPAMTEYDKQVGEITNKYDDLINKKGADIPLLQKLKTEHLAAIAVQRDMAKAISDTSSEFQGLMYLWENEAPNNNTAGDMNIRWERELEVLQSLQPSAELDRLTDQLKDFMHLMDDIPEKAPQVAAAVTKMRMEFDRQLLQIRIEMDRAAREAESRNKVDSAYLNADKTVNSGMGFGGINSQLEAEKTAIQEKYDLERKAIQDRIDMLQVSSDLELEKIDTLHKASMAAIEAENKAKYFDKPDMLAKAAAAEASAEKSYTAKLVNVREAAAKQTNAIILSLNKAFALTYDKQQQDMLNAEQRATRQKLALAANYTSLVGGLLTELANTQDQSSKKGFEAAKDYNLAAAVVSTAAAIMNALSTVQPYPAAVAAAATAAATGAIQIAKISSTTFGGGGSVTAPPSSSFSGATGSGSVGSARGTEYHSAAESRSLDSMQRLADSLDNASVAMTQVADGLTAFEGMLSSSSDQLAISGANGRYTGLNPDGNYHSAYIRNIFTAGGNFLGLDAKSTLSALGNVLFGSGKWKTTDAGVELGITDGGFEGSGFTEQTKKGGWFSSTKNRTIYDEINTNFEAMMVKAIADITSQVNLGTTILGTNNGIKGLDIPAARITTSGRSLEDIQKDVEKWLQDVGNKFAETVEGLAEFAKEGEEAYTALIRLTTALQGANEYFQLIGKTLFDSSLVGANQASKLVELMGGNDEFAKTMEAYFTGGMFTKEQQDAALAAQATARVNEAFAELNMTVPRTRADFIKLVNSLDTTSEAGAATFQALMDIQSAFVTMTESAEDAAKKMQEAFIETAKNAASVLEQITKGNLSTLSPEEQYGQQRAALKAAYAKGDYETVNSMAQDFLAVSQAMNASGAQYVTDYQWVTQMLSSIAGMDSTSPTLQAMNQQITLLEDIRTVLENGTALIPTTGGYTITVGAADNYNVELLAELKALREEVVELRKQTVEKLTSIETKARLVANA